MYQRFIYLKMKRWFATLSLIAGMTLAGHAESVDIDGLYYELDRTAGTAAVTFQTGLEYSSDNYASLPANVVIPETVKYNNANFTVTEIGRNAFRNCTVMESISIPGSVTLIGTEGTYWNESHFPFIGCSALKSVRFEDGAQDISLGCSSSAKIFKNSPLEEVYIGRNINYLTTANNLKAYYCPFYDQSKLAKVTVGPLCTELPDYLFYENQAITLMTLPNVKKIGNSTFEGCSKLTTLNLGNSLESVGNRAFYGDSNITKLTFPNTTTTIGDYAFYNCSSVTEVTVGSGLKSIGNSAFYGCKSFTAVILPDTFTTMGESAFEGCTKLTVAKLGLSLEAVPAKAFKECISLSEMVIPATSISIGNQAFYNCSGLATITMNEGLKTIGSEVFWNNSGVMQFSIPGTVTEMGTNCFYGCTRTTYLTFRDGTEVLNINNNNCKSSKIDDLYPYYYTSYDYFFDCPIRFLTLGRDLTYSYSDNMSLYEINGTSVQNVKRASAPFINSKDLRSVTIGKYVTFLYHHLFDGCSNLSKIELKPSVETLYTYALANCTGLKTAELSTGLREAHNYAFYNCPQLTSLIFPNPLTLLGNYACAENIGLNNVIFNEETGNDLSFTIGDYTFRNCPGLTTLTFPSKTISIGNYCFFDTENLTDITFIDSKREIYLGYGADSYTGGSGWDLIPLFGNSNLLSLYIGRDINYKADYTNGYSPFHNQRNLSDVRFSQAGCVTYCHDYLLYNVNNCESLILPESLKKIGNSTFRGMTILKDIVIPNAVTEMGTYAFAEDTGLKSAKLSTGCAWLKEGVFSECSSLLSITIPPVVTKMDTKLFANCKSLDTVTFEGNSDMIDMGYGASQAEYGLFRDCPVVTLNLDRWLSYNTEEPSRSPFYSIETLKNLNIGSNVGVIDKYMFSYCTGLETVYLPDNIESVGLWGFRGCSSLKDVRLSEKLSQISDYGFSECTSLDNVIFPASMTSIADNSFSNCTSLRKLDLGKSLMIIGPAAFKNDTALEGIEIPETLYGLGVEAFANCTSLPSVAIRAISSVGRQAFQGCTGLQWVSLSDKTTSLGENSFDGCTDIKYVKSYAEFPPEGLVNFPADVVANGTLFVPESSIDYYTYSPTWEEWYSIRPITDNVLVSSISLNETEHNFKATETLQLIATVGAEEATDKGVLWRSSDENIATVDTEGLVTAVSVGDVIVTAIAADGSGIKAECSISVLPTMVESIQIASANNTLKKGRTISLNAKVMPLTATNSGITWSSSDSACATVNEEGLVKAISAGEVEIIATAADGSGITATFALTVIPPTKGDSNDNDELTITDAVNTANYAVGNEVENFNFEAADVNGDNRITLADASGTVTELLNQPIETTTSAMVRRMSRAAAEIHTDNLSIADYTCKRGETATVDVTLDNSMDYVALQADIIAPEGMTIVSVEIGERAEATHTLMQRRINDNTIRIALFDLNNSGFADNESAIIRITVKNDHAENGDIAMSNILASDASANEYVLTSTSGHNSELSGISAINGNEDIRIESAEDGIAVYNAEGKTVNIYTVDGMLAASFVCEGSETRYNLAKGMYIVAVNNTTSKVIVK